MKKVIIFIVFFILIVALFANTTLKYKDAIYRKTSIFSYAQNDLKGKDSFTCIIKTSLSKDALAQKNIQLNSKIGNIATIKVTSVELADLYKDKAISQIYFPVQDHPLLDVTTSDAMTGADYLGCDADSLQSLNIDGSNTIVGILDYYPLNWKHDDFSDTAWNTDLRVLYIWNQNDDTGTHPTGFTYGTEYSKSDLMSDNGPTISGANHSTQCTGIAAGDGSGSGAGSPYKGMAPGAEIIYVHKKSSSDNTIDAYSYFSQKANELGKPIIVSFSGGTPYGITNGDDPISIAIDNFCESGKMATVAAGNYYSYDHAQSFTTFGSPTNDITIKINSYTDSGTGQFDDLIDNIFYFKSGDNFDVIVTDPSGISYETTITDDDEVFDSANGRLYILHNDYPSIEVVITDEVGTVAVDDIWTIALSCPDASYDDQGGKWSAWIYEKHITGQFTKYQTSDNTLNVYASGKEIISVGAYSKTTGAIYSGCSSGYSFDDRILPQICTPTGANTATNAGTNTYTTLGATSGASPHAAGMVALLFQLYPHLSPTDIIDYFIDSAWTDSDTNLTGPVPNKRFGYGKMNCPGIYELTTSANVEKAVSQNNYRYSFDDVQDTGIDIIFQGLSSSESVIIKKYPSLPVNSDIPDANRSNYRWVLSGEGFSTAELIFDVNQLAGVSNANSVNFYKRETEGSGSFGTALTKTVNGSEISITVSSFSEIALGSDDNDNPLPVILSEFTAMINSNGQPQLSWITQSETDNIGWNIYRGNEENALENGTILKINKNQGLIPAMGNSNTETDYLYIDENTHETEQYYWYWLESVEYSGNTNIYHPIKIYYSSQFDYPPQPNDTLYGLKQNYPNPFNPTTLLSFTLDANTHGKLEVFNVKGERIAILFDDVINKDQKYDILWNGYDEANKSISSGIFFYKLSTPMGNSVRKMVLLK